MCATFTDDDVGKTVVNANGDEIGIVSAVEHGSARVEPDPGITDKFRAKIGWEDTDEDTYPLQDHSVSRVTDDEVHLEQDLAGVDEADAGTGVGTNDAGRDTGVTDDSGIGDDTGITDDSGIGDDDRGLTDDDDDLIGDDDRRSDDDDLIGDDDDDLIGDDDDDGLLDDDDRRSDDDDLIGDDDDDLIGDDDRRSDDDDLIGDDDDDDDVL